MQGKISKIQKQNNKSDLVQAGVAKGHPKLKQEL